MKATTWTHHCSACGGKHFHSLAAFDAHRTGATALTILRLAGVASHRLRWSTRKVTSGLRS
jgi:hypothetical protein